jgi:hypothetical protein
VPAVPFRLQAPVERQTRPGLATQAGMSQKGSIRGIRRASADCVV